jgi:hypothetical protein
MLWGFSPALLIALPVLGGWRSEPFMGDAGEIGGTIQVFGILSMPFILYAWSVAFLRWYGHSSGESALFGFLLTIPTCAGNLFLGIAGCSWMTGVVPKEGIF